MSFVMAMVLAARMAVPGTEPLDLSGEWEGRWRHAGGWVMRAASTNFPAFPDRSIIGEMPGGIVYLRLADITDEGKGKLRIAVGKGFLGIYKQHGGLVVLCIGRACEGYPKSFWRGEGQHLLILRRVAPAK